MHAKYYHTSKIVLLSFLGLIWLLTAGPAVAGDEELIENFWVGLYGDGNNAQPSNVQTDPQTDPQIILWKRLAKAKPDECYQGIGNPNNIASFMSIYPGDMTGTEFEICSKENKPKVNQAYVWGLTRQGDNLWFGTIANTLCLVIYNVGFGLPPLEINDDWVCEGGPGDRYDVRPPRIFLYNTEMNTLDDQTNKVLVKGDPDKTRLLTTIGLRSAGNNGGVVFLGGISGGIQGGGINLFAFNAATKAYLGSKSYDKFNNIRQWRLIKGQLYVGVGKPDGGEVWRWTGSLSKYKQTKNLDDLFKFEVVGDLKADPAYLAEHKNRIFVSTWGAPGSPFGTVLYMSPPFGSDNRLGVADKNGWTIQWRITDYEVEPAAFYVGGAVASYGDYLYWGTMAIPGLGLQFMEQLYPGCNLDTAGMVAGFLGTYRPIHIFRGLNFGKTTPPKIELLYGLPKLPKFDSSTCKWDIVPNAMGKAPKFGLAGMNNLFNNYTWWMEPFQGRLFVGTMDWLYLAGAFARAAGVEFPDSITNLARHFEGADLFSFKSTSLPALPASMNGLGNYLNYGVRTMVADRDYLYLGTANPMNLATDQADNLATDHNDKKPEGGWELYKLGIRNECCTSEDSCYNPCY